MKKLENYLMELFYFIEFNKIYFQGFLFQLDSMIVYYKKDVAEILLFYKKIQNSNYRKKFK